MHQHLANLEQILKDERARLCNDEMCPQQLECTGKPERRCTRYRQRQVCDVQETYCLDVQD
jgi:hypothetical protein